jgi:hypothetical protein
MRMRIHVHHLRDALPEIIVTALALAVVIVKLHVPTFVGVADSGDYARLMQPLGLHEIVPANLQLDYYVNQYYGIGPRGPIEYPSSALVVLWPAVRLSALLHRTIFDMAISGYLYAAMFLLGVFLIVRGVRRLSSLRWRVWLVGLAVVAIFADTAYLAYFHSLFGEPVSYTCLLITVGALLNLIAGEQPDYFMLVIFTAACAGLVTAKTQDLVLVLPLAGFCFWLATLHQERRWRIAVGVSCVFVALMTFAVSVRTPSGFRQIATYDSVFLGILHGDTPAQARSDLQTLGVDPQYAFLADQPFYVGPGWQIQKDPDFVADFYGHVNQLAIVKFYMAHPLRLLPGMGLTANAAAALRPTNLGNFLPSSGMPKRALSYRVDVWSGLIMPAFPRSPWVLLVIFLAYLGALVFEYRAATSARARALVALCGLIGAWAALEFVLVYIGDGTSGLVKHLFLFDALFDLMLVIGVMWLITHAAPFVAQRAPHLRQVVVDLLRSRMSDAKVP